MVSKRAVAVGSHSAFWGDSATYAEQFVTKARVDYLIGDYLAEVTMSLLARAKAKDPGAGFATDYVTAVGPLLGRLMERGTRLVSNAGGLNPRACRDALHRIAAESGLTPRIAIVEGDDLKIVDDVRDYERFVSANAYLGAFPIARALEAGADVVICGRVVDSALTLGPLIFEFGWKTTDFDKLAGGSLAGHVIECGAQATGGLYTDWEDVPGWSDMGMPIVHCVDDGSFQITKVEGTGGLVTAGAIAEQILYEIGDPRAYELPDVSCDFAMVELANDGPDHVSVTGARGRVPSGKLKVCGTRFDGYRVTGTLLVAGGDAAARAKRTGAAIVERTRRIAAARGFSPYEETSIEVVGAGDITGRKAPLVREAVLKLAARHESRDALELFANEFAPAACAMGQGTTGLIGGRPTPSPVIRPSFFYVERDRLDVRVDLDGRPVAYDRHAFDPPAHHWTPEIASAPPHDDSSVQYAEIAVSPENEFVPVPGSGGETVSTRAAAAGDTRLPGVPETARTLRSIALGRSGDKGDTVNIGIVAREPRHYPELLEQLTAARVAERFAYVAKGPVRRYELPGLFALNFVIENALGGGGVASLRYDPLGKTFAQILLDDPVERD